MNTATMPNLGLAPETEQRVAAVLQAMGLTVLDACRIVLTRIAADGRFPFADNSTTTMTASGQVTIPESVRTAAGLAPGVLIEMSASNGGVLIKRAENKRRPLTKGDIEAVAGTADIK